MIFHKFRKTIKNILIVEDEPLVAFDNELRIAEAGYQVIATLDNSAQAIELLQKGRVELLVADIKLRGGDNGIRVAEVAHDMHVPVLFATGNCPAAARSLALGCLKKPYSGRELVKAIEAIDRMMQGKNVPNLPQSLMLFDDTETDENNSHEPFSDEGTDGKTGGKIDRGIASQM